MSDLTPIQDEKDPEEDLADYPVDGGEDDDNESSDDDDDDDDDVKDEEDEEEEEHLAPADPSALPIDDLRVVAERVANAIEAIAIYEMKTNMVRKSMSQTKRQEDKVAVNASNKRNGKVTTMEARANKTKGIRCREHTLLGQSTRRHMRDLYLCATSVNFTIMDRAL
nr:hypothetical protein [Tanacetum cinerariifolium]